MIKEQIDMPIESLYSGESFKCEKTGIELIKYTPLPNISDKLFIQYKLFAGNKNYVLQEDIFNIIKSTMI